MIFDNFTDVFFFPPLFFGFALLPNTTKNFGGGGGLAGSSPQIKVYWVRHCQTTPSPLSKNKFLLKHLAIVTRK